MTDRHAGYIVTLDHDVREDDADPTIMALEQIKGVLSVRPIVSDHSVLVGEQRALRKLREALWKALREETLQ